MTSPPSTGETQSVVGAPRISSRGLAAAALVLIAWAVVLAALTPIHLSVRHDSRLAPRLTVNGKAAPLVSRPELAPMDLLVENRSEAPREVQFTVPTTALGATVLPSDFIAERGDWHVSPLGGKFVATEPGSRIRFRGVVGGVSLMLVQGPGQGVIALNGERFELDRGQEGFLPWSLSRRSVSTTSRIWAFQSLQVELAGLGADGVLDVSIANQQGWQVRGAAVTPVVLSITRWDVLVRLLRGLRPGAALVLLALVMVALLALSGSGVLLRWGHCRSVTELVAYASGGSLVAMALLAASLSYLLTGRSVAVVIAVVMFGASCASAVTLARGRVRLPGLAPDAGALLGLAGVILAGTVVFWPLAAAGEWYLGDFQTDSYYYTGLPVRLQTESLVSLNSMNGFGVRAIELVSIGLVSTLAQVPTRQAVIVLAIATWVLTCLCVFVAVRREARGTISAGLAAIITAAWAPSAALYMQGYFAQYLFVFALVFVAMSALGLMRFVSEDRPFLAPSRDSLAFAVGTAFCLALYPYFTFLPAVVVGLTLSRRWARWRKELSATLLWAGVLLLCLNTNLLVMVNVGQAEQFQTRLDELAQCCVFPFYREGRFFNFLLGWSPFSTGRELVDGFFDEFSFGVPLVRLSRWLVERGNSRIGSGLVSALLLGAAALNRESWVRNRPLLVLLTAITIQVSVAGVMGLQGHTYGYAKLLWTTSALLPLVLGLLLLVPARVTPLGWRWVPAVALVLGALSTSALVGLKWYGNTDGAALFPYHLSVWRDAASVVAISDARASETKQPLTVRFSAPGPGIRGTDKDRVLLGHLAPALAQLGVSCLNCLYDPHSAEVSGADQTKQCDTDGGLIIFIGREPEPCGPVERVLFRGEYLTLVEVSAR